MNIIVDHKLRVSLCSLPIGIMQDITSALSIPNLVRQKAKEQNIWGWQQMPEQIALWRIVDDEIVMPRGFLSDLQRGLNFCGERWVMEDNTTYHPLFKIGNKVSLHPWQEKAVLSLYKARSGIWKSPSGSGKTVGVLAAVRTLACRSLVIVNTKDILDQWVNRANEFLGEHYPVGRIGDGKFDISPYLTIATVQTLSSRYDELERSGFFDLFSFVCLDECFPAGTLVGGVPIEQLQEGDLVPSYDENTNELMFSPITRLMKSIPSKMVRLHFDNGEIIECTSDHPFFTDNGWVHASDLSGCMVRYYEDHEITMQAMRRSSRSHQQVSKRQDEKSWLDILLDSMQQCIQVGSKQQNNVTNQSKIRIGSDEEEESDAQPEDTSKNVVYASVDQTQAASSRWQWSWHDEAGIVVIEQNWIEADHSSDWWLSIPESLQSGFREPSFDDSCRDRWSESLCAREETTGCSKREISSWSRVDRVEILEQGSNGKFGEVCKDGFVYNLEVEGTHTYIVNGLVVHNCHHATAETYNFIVDRFSARYRIGVSATPDKTGDFALATAVLGNIFHTTVPEEVTTLVSPKVIRIATKFEFEYKRAAGRNPSNYPQLLEALCDDPYRNDLIVRVINRERDKHGLVISKRIEHLKAVKHLLDLSGYPHPTFLLTGKEDSGTRRFVIEQAALAPCMIFSTLADEALDIPRLDRLYLIFPQRNPGSVTQQVGRVERQHPDKEDAVIYDFADLKVGPIDAQWRARRVQVYMQRGFFISTIKADDLQ